MNNLNPQSKPEKKQSPKQKLNKDKAKKKLSIDLAEETLNEKYTKMELELSQGIDQLSESEIQKLVDSDEDY